MVQDCTPWIEWAYLLSPWDQHRNAWSLSPWLLRHPLRIRAPSEARFSDTDASVRRVACAAAGQVRRKAGGHAEERSVSRFMR